MAAITKAWGFPLKNPNTIRALAKANIDGDGYFIYSLGQGCRNIRKRSDMFPTGLD